ncbi:MAG: ABC transporter substrate-binding protein [Candidatus Thorarchaeota archaeon]
MKKNRILLLAVVLVISMLTVNFGSVAGADVDVPRDQTVHMCGYWQNGLSPMNPLSTPNVASGTFFMYMPLFESNPQVYEDYTAAENLIGLVGESVSWSSDGSKINIKLRPEAKWSDGEALDADDVVWTLNAYDQYRFSDSVALHVKSIAKGSTAQDVVITLNPGYEYSEEAWEVLLIGQNPILPQHVFSKFSDPGSYSNNWFFAEGFKDEWKVTSGPYQPYASTDTGSIHVYKRVDSWWMDGIEDTKHGITWDLPEPMYIASNHFADNFAQSAALTAGEIDLFGGYQENIKRIIDDNDTSFHTWVEGGGTGQNEYYPLISAMNEIAFNHEAGYPLDQIWLRKGLAAAINYDDISSAASNYLKQGSPVWLDDDQPSQAKYYDETIRKKWDFTPSITKAEEFLSEGAFKHTDGYWYTNDAPEGEIWAKTNKTITADMDELPGESGINLQLGGWRLYCVNGWSDHMAAMHLINKHWQTLGIPVYVGYEEYGDFMTKMQNRDFQMYYSSMGNALKNTPLNFMQYWTSNQPTRNVTQWYNPSFAANLTVFSTATSDTVKEATMDAMQDILGEVMPSIPVAVNGYWYTYNEQYWEGWPNDRGDVKGKFTDEGEYASRSDYVPPTTHWTTNAYGHHLMIINNLVKGKGAPSASPWDFTAVIISIVSIGVATAILRKKR